jgi:di/tricarboxylate transporter
MLADIQIPLLIGTIVAAMVFFSIEKIPTEVTALGLLLFLIFTGLLPPEEAFAGFSSDVVIMMFGLLILMAALDRTGVTDFAGRLILRQTDSSPLYILAIVMVSAVIVGAFMSNTAATAFFLPIAVSLARRERLSPAKFLMPLAFASILASSITLIGTSTNIVISGMMASYDMPSIRMFELAPVGIPIAAVGLIYMFFIGRHLVPDRIPKDEVRDLSSRLYLSEMLIPDGSSLVGQTLRETGLGCDLDLQVLRVIRDDTRYIFPRATTRLEEGDVLLVEGKREGILRAETRADVDIRAEVKFAVDDLESERIALEEVILVPGTPLVGRTLKTLDFRNSYGLQVLAINRHGETLTRKMSHIRLGTGDVLVVQGDRKQIQALERQDLFRILSSTDRPRPKKDRAPISLAIFFGTLVAATANLLPLSVAMLLGALLVLATRCITPAEAYSQVNWTVLILIACMLGLGTAMETTGTARFLAGRIVDVVGTSHPTWLLSGFFIMTVLLTQPMSNQAAAALVLPIALQAASQMNLNPRSFAVMIALAASCSFLTPLEPACLLVYGPGQYRFFDFPRVGFMLSVLIYLISIMMVPLIWPL